MVAQIAMTENLMFPFEVAEMEEMSMVATCTSELWHMRFGHLNYRSLKERAESKMVKDLPKIIEKQKECEECIYAKHNKKSFPKGEAWRASELLELVHMDLCGPMNTTSLGGSKYFMLFIDDFSRMC